MSLHIISNYKALNTALERSIKVCLPSIGQDIHTNDLQKVIEFSLDNTIIVQQPFGEIIILGNKELTLPENFPYDLRSIISKIESVLSPKNTPLTKGNFTHFVLVPSLSEEAINSCLEYILKNIPNNEKEIVEQRYLFIELEAESQEKSDEVKEESKFYYSLYRALEDSKLAKRSSWSKLFETIDKFSDKQVSFGELRRKIESTCFPTGVEEIQEVLFYNKLRIHDKYKSIINKLSTEENDPQNTKPGNSQDSHSTISAIRLLLGAYLAGDQKNLTELLEKIKEIDKDGYLSDELNILKDALEEVTCWQNDLRLNNYISPLREYLKKNKILVIEDRLTEEGWKIALPFLFGFEDNVEKKEGIEKNIESEDDLIKYAKNAHDALKSYKIEDFDIILLDLYSSQAYHGANMLSTIPTAVKTLIYEVRALYDKQKLDYSVATSLPRLVIFSRDLEGVSVRTMLKDLGASDYFLKSIKGEPHSDLYYASFRNALINALKDNIAYILNLPHSQTHSQLNEWLSQFQSCDRPSILRIMKYFRYYSAMNIVKILDNCLNNKFEITEDADDNYFVLVDIKGEKKKLKPKQIWFSYLGRANKSGPSTLTLIGKAEWLRKLSVKIAKKIKRDCLDLKLKDELPGIYSYEGLQEQLEKYNNYEELHIVFIDDVIGSGGQVNEYLKKFINRDISSKVKDKFTNKIYIHILFAIGIKNNKLKPYIKKGYIELTDAADFDKISAYLHIEDCTDSIMSLKVAKHIDFKDINSIRHYKHITNPREDERPCNFEPFGWEKCGGLVATYANAPGNTLPIIWGDEDKGEYKWTPLFPRFFNPWDIGGSLGKCEEFVDPEKRNRKRKTPAECALSKQSCCKRYRKIEKT